MSRILGSRVEMLYAEDLGLAVSIHVTDARRGNIVLALPSFPLTAH